MAAGQEDPDLDDLINKNSNGTGDPVETAPLNLDHLTKGQIDVSPRVSRSPGVCSLVSAHCNYLCFAYPRTCSCLTIVGIGLFMFFVLGSMINPTERFGVIDESHLQVDHLDTSKIDHWCLKGDNDSCRCDDPLEGISRAEFKPWKRAHQVNKESIEAYLDSEFLDVAFLGESLVEQMDGSWMGRTPGGVLGKIKKIFDQNFDRTKSGIEGIALGVAGDAAPNVLYRIQHGEMPDNFNPRVWWLSLGMNDIGRMQCSEEVVVMGILRIVEEIKKKKPDAMIVINSMLPMADMRGGAYPLNRDYEDAFKGKTTANADSTRYAKTPAEIAKLMNATAAKKLYSRSNTTTTILEKHHHPKTFPKVEFDTLSKLKKKIEDGTLEDEDVKGWDPKIVERLKNRYGNKKQPANGAAATPASGSGGDRYLRTKATGDEKASSSGTTDGSGEPETKEEKKATKKYVKRYKRDPINPKLRDQYKIKARDPKSLYMRRNRLPLWTSITAINKQLRKFAEREDQPKVMFFDATKIFTETDGEKQVLKSDHISIRGHPTEEGFKDWEAAILVKLKKILEEQDKQFEKEEEKEIEKAEDIMDEVDDADEEAAANGSDGSDGSD